MNNYLIIFLVLTLTSSYNSQNKIDLATLILPYNSNEILNEKYQYVKDELDFEQLERYYTEDPNLLAFYGIDLANELTNKYLIQNKLDFYVDNEKSQIVLFKLEIYTMKESRKLYNILVEKFGTPLYYDNYDKDFFTGVWEKENATYIFKKNNTGIIGKIKTETSNLFIIDNKNMKYIKYFTNSSFFDDYLDARDKKGDPNYTYRNFAIEDAENGDSDYLNDLEKNKPLNE